MASSYSIGKTFENRDLRVLVLKTNSSQKAVWLGKFRKYFSLNFSKLSINLKLYLLTKDCGIHAVKFSFELSVFKGLKK